VTASVDMPGKSQADLWSEVDVLALVTLEQIDTLIFRNVVNQRNINGVLYGGQVIAQALAAACGTVTAERPCHSLHAYFLRAGTCDHPVLFQVDAMRDGGRFSSRRVTARQNGVPILEMDCSFHTGEPGFTHQAKVPEVPMPEDIAPLHETIARYPGELSSYLRNRFTTPGPMDLRPVDFRQMTHILEKPRRQVWVRVPAGTRSDDPVAHQLMLTYLSDFWLSGVAMSIHEEPTPGRKVYISSLDHALWFHRPVRAEEWLLYDTDSPWTGNGRGLSRGSLYDRSGVLVATVVQEALFRKVKAVG
jgi:acyl-CoA thioesterase-2